MSLTPTRSIAIWRGSLLDWTSGMAPRRDKPFGFAEPLPVVLGCLVAWLVLGMRAPLNKRRFGVGPALDAWTATKSQHWVSGLVVAPVQHRPRPAQADGHPEHGPRSPVQGNRLGQGQHLALIDNAHQPQPLT